MQTKELTAFIAMLIEECGRPTREALNLLALTCTNIPQYNRPDLSWDSKAPDDIADHLRTYVSLIKAGVVVNSIVIIETCDGVSSRSVQVMVWYSRLLVDARRCRSHLQVRELLARKF